MTESFRAQIGEGRQLLELGRSCVHKDYRANSTINMLWKGIATYLNDHDIAYMFGCASFEEPTLLISRNLWRTSITTIWCRTILK